MPQFRNIIESIMKSLPYVIVIVLAGGWYIGLLKTEHINQTPAGAHDATKTTSSQ